MTACAAGALAFQDDLLLDVERLLLEQPDASTCSIDGYGAYGTPQYVSSRSAGLVGGYGYGSSSSSSSLASLDAAGSPGGYGAGYGASTGLGYGYTEGAAFDEAATLTCAPLVTKGRLLGVGGLKNCEVCVVLCARVRVRACAQHGGTQGPAASTQHICMQASCMLCLHACTHAHTISAACTPRCSRCCRCHTPFSDTPASVPPMRRDLQGSFTPLAPQLAASADAVNTSATGSFTNARSTLGRYSWPASWSCRDRVTKAPLWYSWQLVAPANPKLIVTDMALLTGPATKDMAPAALANNEVWASVVDGIAQSFGINPTELQVRRGCTPGRQQAACIAVGAPTFHAAADVGAAAHLLWQRRLHRNAVLCSCMSRSEACCHRPALRCAQIDVMTYENVTSTSPVWPALMGINAQLAAISRSIAATFDTIIKAAPATRREGGDNNNGRHLNALDGEEEGDAEQAAAATASASAADATAADADAAAARHAAAMKRLGEISDVKGIQEAIYDVIARNNGDGRGAVTQRRWVRAMFNQAARANRLPKWKKFDETELRILFDVMATVRGAAAG